MRPVLVELGPVEVHSWGVVVAIAFAAAWLLLRRELERLCAAGEAAFALVLAAAVGGIVGSRVYWFFEHLGDASLTDSFSGAGFTWYGGLLGGAAAVGVIARRRGIPLDVLLGASAPALALGYALGRVACQLAGTRRSRASSSSRCCGGSASGARRFACSPSTSYSPASSVCSSSSYGETTTSPSGSRSHSCSRSPRSPLGAGC